MAAVLYLVFACVLTSAAAVNYCTTEMCGEPGGHTFCRFRDSPSPACTGYIRDPLSSEEKARLVARINHRRSEAAQGKLDQLPPASNMLKLRWVDELARGAQLWADQCRPPRFPEEHDICRDLYSITVGQCVSSVVGEAPGLRPESMVDTWFLQAKSHRGTISLHNEQHSASDFEQMLWAHTYLVGCARSRFMANIDGRLLSVTRLVCNFAPRGPSGALWTPGTPASDCPARSSPDAELPALCTFRHNEPFSYDLKNMTLLKEHAFLDALLDVERNDTLNYHGSLDQMYLTKLKAFDELSDEPYYAGKKANSLNKADDSATMIDSEIAKRLKEKSTTRRTDEINIFRRANTYDAKVFTIANMDTDNTTARPVDDSYRYYTFDNVVAKSPSNYISSITEYHESTAQKIGSETKTKITTENLANNTLRRESKEETRDAIKVEREDDTTTPYVQNSILKRLIELSEMIERNSSDPETTKQLQETLDQMEQALASPTAKVHREMIPLSHTETHNEETETVSVPKEKPHSPDLKDLSKLDSVPIRHLMEKYAPFLEKYQRYFSSTASNICSPILLVAIMLGWRVVNVLQ